VGDQDGTEDGVSDVRAVAVFRYLLEHVHPKGRGPYLLTEVAKGADISVSALKALKAGRKDNPTVSTLEAIARHFEVPMEVWVSDKGPEWAIANHELQQAEVDADVMKLALRAEGLDADGLRYIAKSIDLARQAQGLGPARTGLDLNN